MRVQRIYRQKICDREFIWNPSNSECQCDKSCDIVNIGKN